MRKFIIAIITLLVCLSISLYGCWFDFSNTQSDPSDTKYGTDGTISKKLSSEPTLSASDLLVVSAKNQPVLKTSYRDDEYYYYLFDLGLINNVPLEGFANMRKHENHGHKVTHVIESSTVNTSTINKTLTNTTQASINTSISASVKLAAEVGASSFCKESAEYAYSVSIGAAASETYTKSYAEASSFSETKKTSVSMEFDENAENGYYGYILTGAIEVYAIVVYDIVKDIYVVDYFSDIKQYWIDFYFFKSSNDFVNFEYETIPFTVPNDLPVPSKYANSMEDEYKPITVTMERYNCNDGNHYNKNEQEESADWRSRHNGFELGELKLYGCTQKGNSYCIKNKENFSIKYHVLQNTEDLPRVGTNLTHVENDTETSVTGTNINSKIGYGAYWVRITYADDTQTQYNATNQFKNATSNTYIELVNYDKIDTSKNINHIEVVVVYELYAGGPGFLGIWWHEYSNWRCEYTYNFI